MGIRRERLTNAALGKLFAGSILYTTILFEPLGMCRDNGVTVMDASGTDLTASVMGGVNGMLAEMDMEYDAERVILRRIQDLCRTGPSAYAIAKQLNAEGIRTRTGKEFSQQTVPVILRRP